MEAVLNSSDAYRKSIEDGRALYMDGARLTSAAATPLIRVSVDWVGRSYDSPDAAACFDIPIEGTGLRAHFELLAGSDELFASTAAAAALAESRANKDEITGQRLQSFIAECKRLNRRIALAVHEPRAGAVEVVERRDDGLVVRGTKGHVVGGSIAHELLVLPGDANPKDGGQMLSFAIPLAAPGVRIVNTTTAPRAEDDRHYPVSRERAMPDVTVVLDDVFVPVDRVFVDGDVEAAALFRRVVDLWEGATVLVAQAETADVMLGMAQVIAEMNGVPDVSHIREKLSAMAIYASMCRAGWEAAVANPETSEEGLLVPNRAFTAAGRAYATEGFTRAVGFLHDIAGALLLTVPTVADYENGDTHSYMEKYLRTMAGVTGEDRMRIFHLIRDLTADTYWGWAKVNRQFVSGGAHAQALAALAAYDLDGARHRARNAAGLRAAH